MLPGQQGIGFPSGNRLHKDLSFKNRLIAGSSLFACSATRPPAVECHRQSQFALCPVHMLPMQSRFAASSH